MLQSIVSRLHRRAGLLLGGWRGSRSLDRLEPRQVLAADLSVTLDSVVTGFDWLVPGDRVVFNVTVSNTGDEAAVGEADLKTGAQLVERDISEDPDLLFSSRRLFVDLAPGASQTFKLLGKVPAVFTPGEYRLGAGIEVPGSIDAGGSSNPVNDANELNNLAIADEQLGLYYRFGNWIGDTARNTRPNLKLQAYFNEDGSDVPGTGDDDQLAGWDDPAFVPSPSMVLVNVSLTGGGFGEMTPTDSGMSLELSETGTASAFSFLVRTGSKQMTFGGDVVVNGSLKSFRALGISFVDASIDISGSLADFSASDLERVALSVGEAGAPMKFAAGDMTDVSIDTPSAIASFRVKSWNVGAEANPDDPGQGPGGSAVENNLTAPWVGQFASLGGANFNMNLSGEGARNGVALSKLSVKGVVSGDWSVRGAAGTLAFDSSDEEFFASFAGGLSSLTTLGNLSGVVTAYSMTRVSVRGDLVNATLGSGGFLGDDLDLGGEGNDADIAPPGLTFGIIGQLTVGGGVIGSSIYCGYNPVSETEGVWNEGQTSALRRLTVRTEITESVVFARSLPAVLVVGGERITTAQFPEVFVSA
ncbi:MAG: hypothetical protein ACOYN0_14780 [Phycisphaerales bacterium]